MTKNSTSLIAIIPIFLRLKYGIIRYTDFAAETFEDSQGV